MKLIEWDDKYSVSSDIMDDHHKKLFDIYNNLYTHINQGKGITVVGETLDELIEYSKYHFSEEEALLEKISFPDLKNHKMQHMQFIADLVKVHADIESGLEYVALINLLDTTRKWLQDHILVDDIKYADFVKIRT